MSATAGVRVLLFTGKGGVGKTTTAAATAVGCADRGARTLVLSTDPAHSLADAFGVELDSRPTRIDGCLSGMQLDARARLEASWGELRTWLSEVFRWAGVDAVEAEELAVLPGLDELFALADVREHATSGEWDVLVVDCAPTAETLRLLSLPELLSWWMERLFPLGRQVTRVVGPIVRQLSDAPVAGDRVFEAAERFYQRLDGVKALLADPSVTSARLVVTTEQVVVAEARRLATSLALFGYRVDAVVANRLLPDEITDPWFDRWRATQAAQLEAIEAGFAPVPVLRSLLSPVEPVGIDRLRALAEGVYGDRNPADRLHEGEVLSVDADGDDRLLRLELPFAVRGDVKLARRGGELVLTLGSYRRALLLPDSLRARVVDAALRDGVLTVRFSDRGS